MLEELPRVMRSKVTCEPTGHGNAYIAVSFLEGSDYPVKVACHMGKTSPCDRAYSEAVSIIVSILLQRKADPAQILAHLIGIECCPIAGGSHSVPDAIGRVLRKYLQPFIDSQ